MKRLIFIATVCITYFLPSIIFKIAENEEDIIRPKDNYWECELILSRVGGNIWKNLIIIFFGNITMIRR